MSENASLKGRSYVEQSRFWMPGSQFCRIWKSLHRPRDMFQEQREGRELYHLNADPWEMQNLYGDPCYAGVREKLLRDSFDWLFWNTRHGNVTPPVDAGADGKTRLRGLGQLATRAKLYAL